MSYCGSGKALTDVTDFINLPTPLLPLIGSLDVEFSSLMGRKNNNVSPNCIVTLDKGDIREYTVHKEVPPGST